MVTMAMAATPNRQSMRTGKSTDRATRDYLCVLGHNLLVDSAIIGKIVTFAKR
jgi:hypothetical protein